MLFLGRLLEAPSCHAEATLKELRGAMDFLPSHPEWRSDGVNGRPFRCAGCLASLAYLEVAAPLEYYGYRRNQQIPSINP
jgi:hypothetical protein